MNNQLDDHYKLLATLVRLSFEDLILIFLEAKTGSMKDIDRLPGGFLESIEEVDFVINNLYANRVINNIFKKED
jgi:hypothetical protein